VITGTILPTANLLITFAGVNCVVSAATGTQIDCTLEYLPAAGDWSVDVRDEFGLIPNDAALVAITVPLTVTAVQPATDINFLGGEILTITGSNFALDKSLNSVVMADTTVCDVISSTDVTIICETQKSVTVDANAMALTVTVNNVADSTTLTVQQIVAVSLGINLTPSNVSPVLKTDLTINLEAGFSGQMIGRTDFTAVLINDADASITKDLYIKEIDAANKRLIVKFGGAVSGDYHILLTHVFQGRIDNQALTLTVEGKMTLVAPLTGSNLGGTKVTISGGTFGTDP